jgi:hypothetical protein
MSYQHSISSTASQAQVKKNVEERGWKPTIQFESQQCDWCKGKGVPSHRPQNCRDRNNRASRFYEASSAEQEREDRKAKEAKRAPATPFHFESAEPLVSAFPPGGCRPITKPF